MLLYLAQVQTETIKLIGRLKSDAFLLYIRRQVQEFAEGLSTGMLSIPELFHNIPDNPQSQQEESTPQPTFLCEQNHLVSRQTHK
jgi:hypothetical protein